MINGNFNKKAGEYEILTSTYAQGARILPRT